MSINTVTNAAGSRLSTKELLEALLAIAQELQRRNEQGIKTKSEPLVVFEVGARVRCKNSRSNYHGMTGTLSGQTPCFWEVRFDAAFSGGKKFVRRLKETSLELLPEPEPLLADPYS